MENRIIGIDPGSEESGMVVLDDCRIIGAFNLENKYHLLDKVTDFSIHRNLTVVVEDIKPYSLKLTPQVIDTCKFIGELMYRLVNGAGLKVVLISRYEVKKWVFDTFPDICLPLVSRKNEKKVFDACDLKTKELVRVSNEGKPVRKSSFISVDDKIVTESMKWLYKIPLPKSGSGYNYGLQKHSWQALGAATCFKHTQLSKVLP